MLCRRHCRIPFSFVSSTSSNELGGSAGALKGRPQFSTMIRPSFPLGAHTRFSDWKDFCPAKELLLVFSRTLVRRALVERSNVGKSPLINALVNRKEMAQTSKRLGKTQLISHFRINKRWYRVDLPGYGLSQRFQGASSSRCIEDSRRSLRACYSSVSSPMGDRNVDIFDRVLKTKHRDRAAWLMKAGDPLLERVTENLLDRLDDCRRTFPTALNLGGASHQVHRLIGRRGGVEKMITVDLSKDMIEKSAQLRATEANGDRSSRIEDMHVVADEEFLPFGEGCFDVVLSSLGLHWVNDLPGAMTQCRLALKEDGLFLGAMLGGETLKELRIACTLAQLEREGGISPRISPLAQVRDAGNLLQRAGLALPTIDVDEFTVRYPCALDLIHHLRAMGEVNAVRERNLTLKKDTALATAAVYQSMFGDADGTVPATFQVIYMTGWRPSPSQQIPKRRGSANASFNDLQKAFAPAEEDGTPKSGSQ